MKTSIFFAAAISIMMGTATVMACNDLTDPIECNSSSIVIENREVSSFDRVKLSSALTVNIVCADVQTLEIKADESLIGDVKTEVNNGVLSVYLEGKHVLWSKKRKIEVNITVPSLNSMDVSGACNVDVKGFAAEDFHLIASGASDIDLNGITAKGEMKLEVSGASNVRVSGVADKIVIRASGASDVSAMKVNANIADVRASGASDIDVTAFHEIYASGNGASDIDYYGNPKTVDLNSSGASDITGH